MGSTVITLLPPDAITTMDAFEPGDPVLMGQRLARLK
jgi:hypothetical protein